MEFLFGWIFASVVLFVICFAFWLLSRAPYDQVLLSASSSTSSASERPEHPRETANPDLTASDKKKTHFKFRAPLKGSSSYTHPWLAGSLKGHLSRVLDFDLSPNGKHLMTCSEDRSLILWNCSDFLEREHKCFRLNLDLDHALKVCFAPDSKSLLLCMAFDNTLTVYKLAKKESHAFRIEQVENVQFEKVHKADIIAIGISPDAKYIISASGDTSLAVWDLKGKILKMVNTNHGNNYYACISPCSRFIGTSGFTPDVKVWQVLFSKNGEFQDVTRAFELKGHSSGIYSFAFSQDSSRMASASKDGTFRVWNTDIQYSLGQEPYLISVGNLDNLKTEPGVLSLSPNGFTVVIACGREIRVFRADTGQLVENLSTVHESAVTAVKFTSDNSLFISSGDRHVRLFHNVANYQISIEKATEQLKFVNAAAHRSRLLDQIKLATQRLSELGCM